MSASYHMLSAPAAPAPGADAEKGDEADHRVVGAGRRQQPHSAVKTTSDMTRGFISAMKSLAPEASPRRSNCAGNSREFCSRDSLST